MTTASGKRKRLPAKPAEWSVAALAAGLVFGVPATATGQAMTADELCRPDAQRMNDLAADLAGGTWSINHQAGYVVTQGMVMPHPADNQVQTGSFELRDGTLVLVPHGSPMEVELTTPEKLWNFDEAPSLPEGARLAPNMGELPNLAIGDDDLGLLTDCAANDLPRFVGESSVAVDGTVMHFTLRLIVVDSSLIYGFQQVDATARGIPVMERRSFLMNRD